LSVRRAFDMTARMRKSRKLGVRVAFRCSRKDVEQLDRMGRLLHLERSEFLRKFVHMCVAGTPSQAQEFVGELFTAAMKHEAARMARQRLPLEKGGASDRDRTT
jgi:hypothetical protein